MKIDLNTILEAVILGLVLLFVALFLTACGAAPTIQRVEVPVAVPIDCKIPVAGPAPDLSALAALTGSEPPQRVIEIMGAALAALAEDDARLRALIHGR